MTVVYTVEELDANIERIKRLLSAENTSYSVSPSDGGTGRSVQRIDRDQLQKELIYYSKLKARQTGGATTGRFRVKHATFGGQTNCRTEGWETK